MARCVQKASHFSSVFFTFHLLTEWNGGYTYLGNLERVYEQTDRLGPRHTGSPYSKDSRVRAAPRLGDRAAIETGFRRRPAGQRWVALPCLAQARAGRLDYCGVETQRKQSSRQVLQLDASRPQRIRKRGRQLESPLRRHLARSETQGGLRYAF